MVVDFKEVISALKEGKRAIRHSWYDKEMFIFMQVPATISKDIVPKMQSLPQSVKDEFIRRFDDVKKQIDAIYYDNQIALVNSSNLIVGFSPSPSDVLANDWEILEHYI